MIDSKVIPPPRDGGNIVVVGRVIYTEGAFTSVEPIVAIVHWSEKQGEMAGWHYEGGMSVARSLDDEIIIDFWAADPRGGVQ